jgi:hypothetical protein
VAVTVVEKPVQGRVVVDSRGFKAILINDRENNYLPVISFNSSPFKIYQIETGTDKSLETKLKLSSNFFNVNIGKWEPFIEPFTLELSVDQQTKAKVQSIRIDFAAPLNLNFTEKLIENLYESHQAWLACSSAVAPEQRFDFDVDSVREQS